MRTLLTLLLVALTAAKPPPEDGPSILFEDNGQDSSSILYEGPSILYGVSPEPRSALSCGTHSVAAGTYTITSPNHPSNYGNNLDCQYRLTASAGVSTFAVSCSAFSLESHSSCGYDWLRVASSKFCGSAGPTSSHVGTSLDIDFHSDYSVTSTGYSCTITVTTSSPTQALGCGSHSLAAGTYTIQSPGYPASYANNVDCQYRLTASSLTGTFAVSCSAFSLESQSSCAYDWLRVAGTKFCGSSGPAVTQVGTRLDIDFHSDYSVTSTGYRCTITVSSGSPTEELACGSRSLGPGLYSIKSPGFPSNYGNNQDCVYTLTAGSGVGTMTFACCTFDLEPNSSCSYDWLRVNGVKYCSSTAPALQQSGGTLNIDFHSDSSVVRSGYYCEVRATP